MFYYCNSLKSLDLSNFNTQNVTEMYGMFSGCESLKRENIITKDDKI
jgi:surface protein